MLHVGRIDGGDDWDCGKEVNVAKSVVTPSSLNVEMKQQLNTRLSSLNCDALNEPQTKSHVASLSGKILGFCLDWKSI